MNLHEVVITFATKVLAFKEASAVQATAQKLSRAMRGVVEALGTDSLTSGKAALGADYFTGCADYFDSLLMDASAERIELGKLATDVDTFVKYDMLDTEDTTAAKAALDEWQKLGSGNGPKAQGRRA